jgi:hypothetical protein
MYESRIKYLEKKLPKIDVEVRYRKEFNKKAIYLGNGVYGWCGKYSTDPRELFLMGVLISEGIKFKSE